jgi:hypothetical protein
MASLNLGLKKGFEKMTVVNSGYLESISQIF